MISRNLVTEAALSCSEGRHRPLQLTYRRYSFVEVMPPNSERYLGRCFVTELCTFTGSKGRLIRAGISVVEVIALVYKDLAM